MRLSTGNALNWLRRGLTEGLEIATDTPAVYRGEEVVARISIADPGKWGGVDAGLVCTELYDTESRNFDVNQTDRTQPPERQTDQAIAYETWVPVESSSGEQTVRFLVPESAPFSYEGDCLSFGWEVVARGRKRRGLDAQAAEPISVSP